MKCVECGREMVLRIGKSSGNLFWGCSGFPTCKNTARYVDEENVAAVASAFKPTDEQQRIFDAVKSRSGNIIINAVAGSGKTSTILQAMGCLPKNHASVFLAFNKSIAEELERRAPSGVEVRTLHSLGLSGVRKHFRNIEIDGDKSERLLRARLSENDYKRLGSVSERVYSLLLNNNVGVDFGAIQDVLDYYGIEIQCSIEQLYYVIRDLYFDSKEEFDKGKTISFDEMIYYPAIDTKYCRPFNNIFVDECQDLNRTQMNFVLNCATKDTLVVAVGDRNQSIYGFRGADTQAIDYMKASLHATELPLTTCFRCPKSHILRAQMYVPQIQPKPDAKEGSVFNYNEAQFYATVKKEDLVLCRVNAPLLPIAFDLIQQNKPAYVKGRDIAGSIISLLQKYSDLEFSDIINTLTADANKKAQTLADKGKMAAAAYAIDIANCAVFFLSKCKTKKLSDAVSAVSDLFAESGVGIMLSSVHKAKGLEASRVFIINFDMMPLDMRAQWERQQESNLIYVALTRSKDSLFFVKI